MPGVLERLPGGLEQQALLRVHRLALRAARSPKNSASKRSTLVDEAAVAREHLARRVGVGIEQGVEIPAVGRDRGDGVAAAAQQLPQRRQVVDAAGQAQAGADDGDRLVRRGLGIGQRACAARGSRAARA